MKKSFGLLVLLVLGCPGVGLDPLSTSTLPPVAAPRPEQVLIVGAFGPSTLTRGGETLEADIGMELKAGDVLTTGPGASLDLNLTNLVQARILENTIISVSELTVGISGLQGNVRVNVGTILSKVQILTGGSRFSVTGQSITAGVRGTLFSVFVSPEGAQTIGVAEGRVVLTPAEWPEGTAEVLSDATATELEGTVLPVLGVGEEITFPAGFFPPEGPQTQLLAQMAREFPDPRAMESHFRLLANRFEGVSRTPLSGDTTEDLSALATTPPLPPSGTVQPLFLQAEPADAALEVALRHTHGATHHHAVGKLSLWTSQVASISLKAEREGFAPFETVVEMPPSDGLSIRVRLSPLAQPEPTPPEGQVSVPSPITPAETGPAFPESAPETVPLVGLTIQTQPAAEITINGARAGGGIAELELPVGTRVTLTAQRTGFTTHTETFILDTPASKIITLRPQPLIGLFPAGGPSVGAVLPFPGAFLHTDSGGRLTLLTAAGQRKWSASTSNAPNENSLPVLADSNLVFTGTKEMVFLRWSDGAILTRMPLDSSSAHTFGQRTAFSQEVLVSPTSTGVNVLDPQGNLTAFIKVDGIGPCTPAFWGTDNVLIMSQSGTMNILSLDQISIVARIETPSLQPLASAPLVRGNQAIVIGRTGIASSLALNTRTLVQSQDLSGGQRMSITSDLEEGRDSFYVFARDRVIGVSLTLQKLFELPATTQALYLNRRIYFGQGRQLVVADAVSGRILSRHEAGENLTTKPAIVGEVLAVGTSSGKLALFAVPVL